MCILIKQLHILLDNVIEDNEDNAKKEAVTGLKLTNDQCLETLSLERTACLPSATIQSMWD